MPQIVFRKKQTFIGIVIILLVIFTTLVIIRALSHQPVLVFSDRKTQEIEALLPIEPGNRFSIIFVHSIHHKDVVEIYRVNEQNEIEQTDIIFEEFGIGMPSNAPPGAQFVTENGKYHIKNLNLIMPSMIIRNGKTVSKHRLVWFDKNDQAHQVYFNDYFRPGAWLEIKVKNLPRYFLWKEPLIHDSKISKQTH
ncbi:MAG: DUF1850 domain-containing protein [Alcaligenaceae bacterium]|jgi:hypothetical protein|nr:DUF1850 domain-containing protein [Alcaligenaceae bacterium]